MGGLIDFKQVATQIVGFLIFLWLVRKYAWGPLLATLEARRKKIEGDLAGPNPMHRLLQGDVGSGKTVVAVSTLLHAVQGGHQGALMAPTEVLARPLASRPTANSVATSGPRPA